MKKVSLWLYVIATLLITSCSQDDKQNEINDQNSQINQVYTTKPIIRYLGQNELAVQPYDDRYLLEGDIAVKETALSEEPTTQRGAGLNGLRWTDNTVYYTIAANMPSNKLEWINGAIQHWETNTSLRFEQRTTQPNYVDFVSTNDDFCTSFVGMIGGRQEATVGNCSTGVMIHEIGHAIGLFHEQNRADRDQYVLIVTENIEPGFESAFVKYTDRGIDGSDFTATLDFQSIMMYFPTAFSVNGQPTITRLDGSSYDWQQQVLSPGDLEGIAIMYGDNDNGGGGICDGIPLWSADIFYNPGDQVNFQGSLFEWTGSEWIFLGACDGTRKSFDGVFPKIL